MRKRDVQVGATYVAKVSGKLALVHITSESVHGGWEAVNTATGRSVHIRSAQRLRSEAPRCTKCGMAKHAPDRFCNGVRP